MLSRVSVNVAKATKRTTPAAFTPVSPEFICFQHEPGAPGFDNKVGTGVLEMSIE